ncbi:T9SS type A sorting domain-containing protein [candidate division KSB1 bacterium]|nr:T9SS type A sorting domain-containing protein [candidate division KSB1 bacterium]
MKKVTSRLIFIMLFAVCWLQAQTSQNVTKIGNFGKGDGKSRAIFAQGSLVYYGMGNILKITSFSDPLNPYMAGNVELRDNIEDLVKTSINDKDYVIAVGAGNLAVIDVYNPLQPALIAQVETGGNAAEGVVTSGTYAFVGDYGLGLVVYDISNPANPTKVAGIDSLTSAEGIYLNAPYLYLACGGKTNIVNITDPIKPVFVSRMFSNGWHQNGNARGNYAYICDWDLGLEIFNISNLSNPTYVGNLSVKGRGLNRLIFNGNFGYASVADTGLAVIDFTNPAAPSLITVMDTPGTPRSVSFGAITIGGTPTGHVFLADDNAGVRAINVSNPNTPAETGFVAGKQGASGSAYNSFVDPVNNKLYVAYGSAGVRVLDITNKANPVLLGEFDTPGDARGIVVKDNVAFVADRDAGVAVIDFTNPATPVALATYKTARARGIAMSGNFVYVAADASGMVIIDATNASSPDSLLADATFGGEAVGAGGNIVAISKWDGVGFFDCTDPRNPVSKGNINALLDLNDWHGVGSLDIQGHYVYVINANKLKIFDISDLDSPSFVGEAMTSEEWDGAVTVEGNYAYIADGSGGLRVINITDPANPVEVGFYDGAAGARGVTAAAGYVYVSETDAGISLFKNDLLTAVDPEQVAPVLKSFMVYQNYPNPFNPGTIIRFELAQPALVTVEIRNILGQKVANVLHEPRHAGLHQLWFDAGNLSGGVYFCDIRANNVVKTSKMLLLK